MGNSSSHPGTWPPSTPPSVALGLGLGLVCGRKRAVDPRIDPIAALPPELVLRVVTSLDEVSLEACAQVCRLWHETMRSETVWRWRCQALWQHTKRDGGFGCCGTWRQAYKVLSMGTAVANEQGVEQAVGYLAPFGLVEGQSADAVACFLRGTALVESAAVGAFVAVREPRNQAVLRKVVAAHDYSRLLLPDALRVLFCKMTVGGKHNSSRAIAPIFRAFADRYIQCNPDHGGPRREALQLLCYSVLLLSVDLYNPHVTTKMKKAEFVINNWSVLEQGLYDVGFLGRLYDNVELWGHVAQPRRNLTGADALAMLT